MTIFDTLAENRYQQWLDEQAQPDYKTPHNTPTREDLLATVRALHIQLTVSLEKKYLPLVADMLTRSVRQRLADLDNLSTGTLT